jgi:hypothetical protein
MRLFFSAVAWLAIVAAGLFVFSSERTLHTQQTALDAFDRHAREAVDALSDLRVGQQAYVAAGQGVAFWMPKVSATMDAAAEMITGLRRSASAPVAVTALDEASSSVSNLRDVDARARDYLQNGQQLMAGDIVFSEGNQAAVGAAHAVERARVAEREAQDAAAGGRRRLEAIALGAAGLIAALVIGVLVPMSAVGTGVAAAGEESGAAVPNPAPSVLTTWLDESNAPPAGATQTGPDLGDVARLCTEFGQVRDVDALRNLLSQTAALLDASGLVVWMGDTAGGDLRPALAHGYTPSAFARIPALPRAADNAAAAAYRTGMQQIVRARADAATGAIVVPILTPEGCMGVLSAEVHGGSETSAQGQAVAALVAAQLAGILSVSADAGGGQSQVAAG